jgi:hypothetical protein
MIRDRFVIHVCPVCQFYDADPVLRRMPGSRHAPMRCFACGKAAQDNLNLSRIASSARSHYMRQAMDEAPLMRATEVIRAVV